jgi:hypothetical protein
MEIHSLKKLIMIKRGNVMGLFTSKIHVQNLKFEQITGDFHCKQEEELGCQPKMFDENFSFPLPMPPLEVKNPGEEDEGAKRYGIKSNRIHMGGNYYSTIIKMEGNLQAGF